MQRSNANMRIKETYFLDLSGNQKSIYFKYISLSLNNKMNLVQTFVVNTSHIIHLLYISEQNPAQQSNESYE